MGEIISIAHKGELTPSFGYVKKEGYCRHMHIEVDRDSRKINCSACKEELDPIDFIMKLATEEQNQWYVKKELKRQIDELEKEHKELTRVVTNLKSQKRRLA